MHTHNRWFTTTIAALNKSALLKWHNNCSIHNSITLIASKRDTKHPISHILHTSLSLKKRSWHSQIICICYVDIPLNVWFQLLLVFFSFSLHLKWIYQLNVDFLARFLRNCAFDIRWSCFVCFLSLSFSLPPSLSVFCECVRFFAILF